MHSTSVVLLTCLVAIAVSANPIVIRDNLVRLPLARQINVTSPAHIVKADQARAAALISKALAKSSGKLNQDAVISSPAQNQAVSYIASVAVGSPSTTFDLIIDTGSSNTWVGAGTAFKRTSTTTQTKDSVSVTYGSGSFSGTEFTDQVSLGSGLTIKKQSIGVASKSTGFDGVDGILGIGPVDLTLQTLSPDTGSTIPTVVDNLFTQGTISSHSIAVSFEPTTSATANNGELTFGGTDSSKFTGSITFAPITSTSPANEFWGINQSIRLGTSTSILSNTAGIVDTGTTLVLIATDAFNRYKSATGAVLDNNTGLLRLTTAKFNTLPSLFFTIAGTTFEFTANAQAWPRSLNTLIGGTAGNVYLVVADLGSNTGSGLDFINGQTFLERFYSVFDTANKRVGIAKTPFTTATSN
ncbi:aspartic peptidase A1 [Rickenella mellea]|uniref:Aspartic peptidase A1 n=1 Tax=Rickenella mellea TaxID=50990 RepID=A0A4Y7QLG9_9AGAM|nr:aspartic peptidase A1 [Rickenella mellea]